MPGFRFNAKNVFLTYPKCDLPLELFIHGANKYLICQETHADGTYHVHCFLHFENKINTINERKFDVQNHHPNIQSCRNPVSVMAYVRKGGNYITNMSEEEMNQGKIKSNKTILAEKIIQKGTIDSQLILENPEVIFLNYDNTMKYLAILKAGEEFPERPNNKRRHLWLYGESNTGKTYHLDRMLRGKMAAEIPTNNDWIGCDKAEVLWADEYKGHLTIQQLNRVCDGNTKLNTKGGSIRISYPIIVICSNYSISECYSKSTPSILDTLYNRFIQYQTPLVSRLK